MSPSFKSFRDESQTGSHIILRIPMPVSKNIESAKYPKVGRKKAKDPKEDKRLLPVLKPTAIKAMTIAKHAYPIGLA